ncbi:MAG: DNA-directed RNA polymerase subunit omega [Saccharofermentanales bacterium]
MLVKPTMETLLKKVSSRYVLTILAAKRARQLVDGAQPMAKSDTPNFVTNACEEIAAGKVLPIKGIHHVNVPLRPEVEAERLRDEIEKRNARYREDMEEESNARIRSLIAVVGAEDELDDEEEAIDADLVVADDIVEIEEIEEIEDGELAGPDEEDLLDIENLEELPVEEADDFTTMEFPASVSTDAADEKKDKTSKRRKTK